MSTVDQSRAYLSLREQITQLRQEFGEDTAWWIVESAVRANITQDQMFVHKMSKPQLKCLLSNKKSGETA
jgi:hypothetical protein